MPGKTSSEATRGQNELEVHAAVFQSLLPLVQREHAGISGLIRKEFVGEEAVHAAAVIPHDEHVLVCRIVLFAPGNEITEGLGIAHGCARLLIDEFKAFLRVRIPLKLVCADVQPQILGVPFLAAAGLDDEMYIVRRSRFGDFPQVIGTARFGSGVALEVRTAHIEEYGPGVVRGRGGRCRASGSAAPGRYEQHNNKKDC